MRLLLSIFTISLLLFSCKDAEVEKHVATINNMESTLDSLENELNANKIDTVGQMISTIRNTILIVKNNYDGGDTVNYEVAQLVDNYKAIRKKLSPNNKLALKLEKAMPEEREQLSNLKHDIENGINEREKYTEFIAQEKAKVEQIKQILTTYVRVQKESVAAYNTLHPQMKEFTDGLLENANASTDK